MFKTMDLNIATNAELKAEAERLTNEFEEAREELSKCYYRMLNASLEYNKVQEIIDKRNGVKNDGED